MKWIKFIEWKELKEGTICRTEDGNFVMVGEINTAIGINDEFVENITHYTEDCIDDIKNLLKEAKDDFDSTEEEDILIPEKEYKSTIDYSYLDEGITEKFKEKYGDQAGGIMFEIMGRTFNVQDPNKDNNENRETDKKRDS